MKDKSKLLAIGLVILTIVVVIISLVFKDEKNSVDENKIRIVTNYSNFYTVNSCLYRTITYLGAKDKENLLLVLNDDYKDKNNITKDNILSLFNEVGENYTFDSKKMYYQKLNDEIYKYYVYGVAYENKIYDDTILSDVEENDFYFIVYIDTANEIFSIEPYDGKLFIEGDIDE